MEARWSRIIRALTLLFVVACFQLRAENLPAARAAGTKTTNFIVNAPTAELAQEIGAAAEEWRKRLAVEWLGRELPNWSEPCHINARVAANLGAGGATSFVFDRGQVFDWRMNIQGTRERLLDSVLPHEITHTIFATHFRQPLPRWADEGACTTVEHRTEVAKQERMLVKFLKTRRGIPFSQMFAMKEYPHDVMPLYSQGHSVSQWLIESQGRRAFLDFLADGMQDENWPRAVQRHYGFSNLAVMQDEWLKWVKSGRPRLSPESSPITQLLASQGRAASPAGGVLRGQSPDDVTPIAAAPAGRDSADSSSKIVTTSGSVYAMAAARAEKERRSAVAARTAPADGASIYDASRGGGVLRR